MCKSKHSFSQEQTGFSHQLQQFPLNQDGSIPVMYRKHLDPEQRQTLNQTFAYNGGFYWCGHCRKYCQNIDNDSVWSEQKNKNISLYHDMREVKNNILASEVEGLRIRMYWIDQQDDQDNDNCYPMDEEYSHEDKNTE